MNDKIWLSPPHLTGKEETYIKSALTSNWITSQGPALDAFETDIQKYLETNNQIVALNSGTSAIHLALQLLNIGKDDIVLCQNLTFVASVNPVKYLEATPVFIDSERDTWNMCPVLLEEAIQVLADKGFKPKAIIAVHLYGMPYKINEIHLIGKKYHIPIIEDAAEAMGSEYNGKKCGTFGDLAIFSFNGNKIITTSGGGALIVENQIQKSQSIYLATQAKDDAVGYSHSKIGYNYRLSNLLASVGRAQLEVIDERVKARQKNFKFYKKQLSSFSEICFQNGMDNSVSNRWLSCILLTSKHLRDGLLNSLNLQNIEARPIWKPMNLQTIYQDHKFFRNGVSKDLYERGLCLPSGSNLTEKDLLRITNCIVNNIKKDLQS